MVLIFSFSYLTIEQFELIEDIQISFPEKTILIQLNIL